MDAGEQGGLPPGLAVSITVIRGPDVGTKYFMTGAKVILGRKRGELLLHDREASGIHASVERIADGKFILRDLGSTNGTFLDGRRVTATEIRPGQQIKVGANYLLFTVTEETVSDTTRHASGEISGQMVAPPPAQELVFGKTAISTPERPILPAPKRNAFDADLGEPDLSSVSTARSPVLPGAPAAPAVPEASEPVSPPPAPLPSPAHPWKRTEAGPAPTRPAAPPAPAPAAPVAPSAGPPRSSSPAPTSSPAPSSTPVEALPPGVERSIYGVYLLVERGKDRGKVFPINRQVTVLGRSGTEVLIDDQDISRRHAALDVQGEGKYILRDLASTNGTLLNGVRIQTESIQTNDKIRMGSTTIKLLVGDARVASELARVLGGPPA